MLGELKTFKFQKISNLSGYTVVRETNPGVCVGCKSVFSWIDTTDSHQELQNSIMFAISVLFEVTLCLTLEIYIYLMEHVNILCFT